MEWTKCLITTFALHIAMTITNTPLSIHFNWLNNCICQYFINIVTQCAVYTTTIHYKHIEWVGWIDGWMDGCVGRNNQKATPTVQRLKLFVFPSLKNVNCIFIPVFCLFTSRERKRENKKCRLRAQLNKLYKVKMRRV